jgi:peptide/nickel transport system permease protein
VTSTQNSQLSTVTDLKVRDEPEGQIKMIWRQFRKHKLAVISTIILLLLLGVAAAGDSIAPHDPNEINPQYAKGYPQPPDSVYVLGTDELGRDYLSRAISGARISLSVGFVAVGISLFIGLILGSVAGYFSGNIDGAIMRIVDIFLSVPNFFLILTVNAYLPPSIYNIMIIIGLFSWMGVARLVRGQFLSLKEKDFVVAAQSVGVPGFRLILRHLLPNAMAPVIVAATLAIPAAILTESSLSFLGLGVQPPQASWGSMLENAQSWLSEAWWMWVPPGLLISITVLAFNFIGDGLRDSLDPYLRR